MRTTLMRKVLPAAGAWARTGGGCTTPAGLPGVPGTYSARAKSFRDKLGRSCRGTHCGVLVRPVGASLASRVYVGRAVGRPCPGLPPPGTSVHGDADLLIAEEAFDLCGEGVA